jgi:hypothetical protein
MLIAGLIDHPEMGLILFETGSAEDVTRVCTQIQVENASQE